MIGVVGQKWRTSGYHWQESAKLLNDRCGVETYLVQDVFQRVWAVNGEADEKQIGLGVGEGS